MKANWRGEILYAVTLLMESCWLSALLLFLNELVAGSRRLSIIWLWLMYPAAFLLNRLLCSLGWRRYRCYAINGLVLALGTLLVIKTELYSGYSLLDSSWLSALGENMSRIFQVFQPEFLAILGSGLLFWRGWHLAQRGANFTVVGTSFQFGLSILLIVLFFSHLTGVSFSNAILLVIVFSFLSLAGIGLCRSTEVAPGQAGVSIQKPQLLLSAVGLTLLLGLLIGSFVTNDLMNTLLDALRWLWGIIMKIIAFLLSLLPQPEPAEPPPPLAPVPQFPPEETFHLWVLPEAVRDILGKLVMSGFLALILIALYRMFSDIWHRLRGVASRGVTIESLPITFRAILLELLRRFLHRVFGIFFPWRLAPRRSRVGEGQPENISSIRHIYRNLLRWGAESGWPRRVNETPYEYSETLGLMLPGDGQGQLAYITEAYVIARYRQSWENGEPVQQIRESWEKLRRFKPERPTQKEIPHGNNYLQEV